MQKLHFRAAPVLTDALFPRRCPVCGGIVIPKGGLICPSCLKEISFIKSPSCKKCGKEVMDSTIEYCYDCMRHKRSFDYGVALVSYNEAAKKSMAGIKYKNRREYIDFYIDETEKRLLRRLSNMNADALVPVPVHPSRLRKRGYNQAELLAKGLEEMLEIPLIPGLLKRERRTEPQKILSPAERLRNLEKAFRAGPVPEEVKSVILVDDIYTTGSTIEACTRVLKAAGIKKVYFFAVCIGQGQ